MMTDDEYNALTFTGINGGGYGGCLIDAMPDGTFRTRTCCDWEKFDRDTMVRLYAWLGHKLWPGSAVECGPGDQERAGDKAQRPSEGSRRGNPSHRGVSRCPCWQSDNGTL